jgi:hypothetical protein
VRISLLFFIYQILNTNMKDIVFYSKSRVDIYSPKLLQIMKTMPFAKKFSYYCIDVDPLNPDSKKDVLNLFDIREVPTMYVEGNKLVGPEAFEWLQEINSQIQRPQQQQVYQQQQGYQQQQQQGYQQQQQGYQQQQQQGYQNQQPQQRQMPSGPMLPDQQQQPFNGGGGGGLGTINDSGSNFASLDQNITTISGQDFNVNQLTPVETKQKSDNYNDILKSYEQQYKSDLKPVGLPDQQQVQSGFAGMRM